MNTFLAEAAKHGSLRPGYEMTEHAAQIILATTFSAYGADHPGALAMVAAMDDGQVERFRRVYPSHSTNLNKSIALNSAGKGDE